MIFILLVLFLNCAEAFPNFLTQEDYEYPGSPDRQWDCFFTSEIKKMRCREWIDYDGGENSEIDLKIENAHGIYLYGFNSAHHVCRDIKKQMQVLLKGQKYFCMYAYDFGASDFELRGKDLKPVSTRIYQCLKSPAGQVGWFGEFGDCP